MAADPPRPGYRGGPLIMLLMLVIGWVGLRAVWWDDPLEAPASAFESSLREPVGYGYAPQSAANPYLMAAPAPALMPAYYGPEALGAPLPLRIARILHPSRLPAYAPAYVPGYFGPYAYPREPDLGLPAFPSLPPGTARAQPVLAAAQVAGSAPFLATPRAAQAATKPSAGPGRWSLDSWAFYRQGSEAAPVSQGRVPVYGASQAGAVVQYRLARASRYDPRLYLRAYQANVPGGESELAFGASLRPLPRVPLRLAGEARYTTNPFGSEIRPAAYAVTEFDPVPLPLGTRLEAYGQAGWVGGAASTAFADGQAIITRNMPVVGRLSRDAVRMSFGAGVWGGAQKDAQRLDIGPTLRFDVKVGRVPTRVSVDYRQRVAGDAAPASGVAATISAGF